MMVVWWQRKKEVALGKSYSRGGLWLPHWWTQCTPQTGTRLSSIQKGICSLSLVSYFQVLYLTVWTKNIKVIWIRSPHFFVSLSMQSASASDLNLELTTWIWTIFHQFVGFLWRRAEYIMMTKIIKVGCFFHNLQCYLIERVDGLAQNHQQVILQLPAVSRSSIICVLVSSFRHYLPINQFRRIKEAVWPWTPKRNWVNNPFIALPEMQIFIVNRVLPNWSIQGLDCKQPINSTALLRSNFNDLWLDMNHEI